MRLFLITSAVPDPARQAVHIVLQTLIDALEQRGHHVTFQCVVRDVGLMSAEDRAALERLSQRGVEVPPLLAPSAGAIGRGGWSRRLQRWIRPEAQALYPELSLVPEVRRRVQASRADAMLIFWNSEGLAASFGLDVVPKVVYYGMPDHAAAEARFAHPALFDIPRRTPLERLRLAASRRENQFRRALHVQMMMDCQSAHNICAFHAAWYTQQGHPRSSYLQNTWPDHARDTWQPLREVPEAADGAKLLGSVGRVIATGNTFGLHFLGTSIMPLVRRRLGSGRFGVHLYGSGRPYSSVARALDAPETHWRGWVPDIDAEIRSCQLFLVMNNAGFYKGSHTRFLHAWSLGSCVIAHRDNARAMPEIRHLDNALLGETPEELVEWIVTALRDPDLRRRIGDGGRRTYETSFAPDVVVPRLLRELEDCAAPSPATALVSS